MNRQRQDSRGLEQGRGRRSAPFELRFRLWLHSNVGRGRRMLRFLRVLRRAVFHGPWQSLVHTLVRSVTRNPPIPHASSTLVSMESPSRTVEDLERDGVAAGVRVDTAAVESLRDWWNSQDAKRVVNVHQQCSVVDRILRDPAVLDVVRRYLGIEPTGLHATMTMSMPGTPTSFHYETSDVRAVGLYVFLTDVDEETGAHEAIRGTHRRKPLDEIVADRRPESVLRRRYPGRVVRITGPRGTAFFEDPAVTHQRLPTRTPRLALVLGWSTRRTNREGACGDYDIFRHGPGATRYRVS